MDGVPVPAVACIFQKTGDCYILKVKIVNADDDFAAGQEAARDIDRVAAVKLIPLTDLALAGELSELGYITIPNPIDFREVHLLHNFLNQREGGFAMPNALATVQVKQEVERREPPIVALTIERLVEFGHPEIVAMQKVVKARVVVNWVAVHERRRYDPDQFAAILETLR
jgi:hypothetical protein